MADEQKAAVYVSWSTFKNAVEGLAQGIPNQIDRSTFPGFSGGVQSQLLAGLKFLGLTDDNDKPTAALEALAVPDENKRKAKLKEIVEDRYKDLIDLDLMKTTPQQLMDKMGESYGVTGDTKIKAVRFFLMAIQYVGIPVSRFIKVPGSPNPTNGTKARKKSASRIKADDDQGDDDIENAVTPKTGTSRVVQLSSGGTLTLTASLDLFQLSPTDRTFVFALIDKLETYEKEAATTGTQ